MIKNLLLIALRNFKKDKWYSLINILGLTLGITFSLFLIFYIRDELSFDRYNKNADRIMRIVSYIHERDKNTDWTVTQLPLAETLKKDFPDVEESARMLNRERTLFLKGTNGFYETKIYYADSTLFNIFTVNFLEGHPRTALTQPNSIVISRTLADKYFGRNTPAVGKTMKTVYDLYKVTGVFEDIPSNSHIRYDMLISMSTLLKPGDKNNGAQNWGSFNNFTYVLLKPGVSADAFNKKLIPLYDKYMAPIFTKYNVKINYGVMPITDIHLTSKLQGEPEEVGDMSYVRIFGAVAFFMLLIACINYMNLTTARSARRAKEIGIRKVAGSTKTQLISQFLSESLLTAFISVLLSIGLVILFLGMFNTIAGKTFSIATIFQPFNILLLIGIVLFTGLIGGSYPAFYLASFQPVSILKGSLSKASGNVNLRRTLVVLQFSISMIMLICTWIVYTQLAYIRNKDVGFNKEQVMMVTINTGEDERSKIFAMDNEFRTLPGVKTVGTGNNYPGSPGIGLQLFTVETNTGHTDKGINCYGVDENFFKALSIPVVRGRDFEGPPDTLHGIMVNEAMVKHFGWDNPIGKRVTFPGDTSNHYLEVVGVVKDFNQKSLYNPIEPLLLFYQPNGNIIQIKLNPGELQSTINKTEAVWKKYFPQLP
ncbi:MAG TPA: ABC transporter permease, partial [Puia sp.]|nr:ABC transporter permease [Puia sp.]